MHHYYRHYNGRDVRLRDYDVEPVADKFEFSAARYCWTNKQENNLCTPELAFERHYSRKGWDVCYAALRGCCQSDWYDVVIAVEPGYGTAETLAKGIEDWMFGNVFVVHFYGLYSFGDELEWVHVDAPGGSLGGIYLTGMDSHQQNAYMRELCSEVRHHDECETYRQPLEMGRRAA